MKIINKSTVLMSILGLITVASVYANPAASPKTEVDFNLANPAMQTIADIVLSGDQQIEFAYPKFDTQLSNLENERIFYSIEGQLKNVPWKSGISNGSPKIHAHADFKSVRVGIPGVEVSSTIRVETDVLSLMRYAGAIAKQRYHTYREATSLQLSSIFDRISRVPNLSELAKLFTEGQELGIREFRDQIKNSYDRIQCLNRMECGTPVVDAWGNRNPDYYQVRSEELWISESTQMIGSFEASTIEYDAASDTLVLNNLTPRGFFSRGGLEMYHRPYDATEPKRAKLTLTASRMETSLQLFQQVKLADLDQTHAELNQRLSGIIAHSPDESKVVQDAFREALVRFKQIMNNEKQY